MLAAPEIETLSEWSLVGYPSQCFVLIGEVFLQTFVASTPSIKNICK